MPVKRVVTCGLAVAVVAVSAGCTSPTSSPVSATAAKALRQPVEALRKAANGTSIPDVRAAQQALVQEIQSLESSNDLTQTRAVKIENAVGTLVKDFNQANKPTPPPTTATPTITPTQTPTITPTITVTATPTQSDTESTTATPTNSHSHGGGDGNGNGNGNGHGGDGNGGGNANDHHGS